ncbi:VWA domain-containing protein [Occallatibacter savannae]|uniref:VWA domain-containing protein n=1 Tax=Occallatibacter savannae TaxID=1002691 RepID=UPI000D696B87|nr:VWA domain-containing protein [Occallatibacter savannae]
MRQARLSIGCLLLTAAVIALPAALPAQAVDQDGRFHLNVVVTDSAGKLVAGLQENDFKLLDDARERAIASFAAHDGVTAKPDPEPKIIIVIDAVNNGFIEMGYLRQGLERFLRENEGRLAQPVLIARLTPSGIQYLSQASRDGNALATIVATVTPSVRPRGLDAMLVSFNGLTAAVKKEIGEPGRKVLVWLGPGWPTPGPPQGTFTAVDERNQRAYADAAMQIAKLLHDARIVLYGGYSGAEFYMRAALKPMKKVSDVDGRVLRLNVIAIKSGGKGELPETNRDSIVTDVLDHFAAEANSFYELSFTPPKAKNPDEFHELRVEVKRPGLTARTAMGYYDQPEFSRPEQAKQAPPPMLEQPAADEPPHPGLVTVAQLSQAIDAAKNKRDGEAAKELEHLQLTERLSSPKLALLSNELPGSKSKTALRAVADASVFLDLPKSEFPDRAVPEVAEQKRMVSLAVEYLAKTVPKLPNFFARRTIESFEAVGMVKSEGTSNDGPLHPSGEATGTILYRNGKEEVKQSGASDKQLGLITKGVFGPVLSTVIVDASHGEMKWSHWEDGPTGPMAVFAYRVNMRQSHYEVSYPAIVNTGLDMTNFKTAYHGEVGVDAATGTILRLALVADLGPGMPMQRADIMVEYGTVDIGGKIYTCPVRSVSISRGKSVSGSGGPGLESLREVTRLNDVGFSDYHVFRSEMRIVP